MIFIHDVLPEFTHNYLLNCVHIVSPLRCAPVEALGDALVGRADALAWERRSTWIMSWRGSAGFQSRPQSPRETPPPPASKFVPARRTALSLSGGHNYRTSSQTHRRTALKRDVSSQRADKCSPRAPPIHFPRVAPASREARSVVSHVYLIKRTNVPLTVEFLLGESNLPFDSILFPYYNNQADHRWIPIATLKTSNSVRGIYIGLEDVRFIEALRSSNKLEVNSEGTAVRPKDEIILDLEKQLRRTVHVASSLSLLSPYLILTSRHTQSGFPVGVVPSVDRLEAYFGQAGGVLSVRVLDSKSRFMASVLLIFTSVHSDSFPEGMRNLRVRVASRGRAVRRCNHHPHLRRRSPEGTAKGGHISLVPML